MLQAIAQGLFMRGSTALQAGRADRALPLLRLAARFASGNAEYLGAAALAASRVGDIDLAVDYCERALQLEPDLEPVHHLLFSLFLHGEHYDRVLERIHRHLRPRTYIEIGVEYGSTLKLVAPETLALAVDPHPKLRFAPGPNVRVFAQTSDEFFAQRDVCAELGGLPVDLAFIDGLHHFEYALRDFMNLERLCAPQSTILIDDCFPHDRRTAERQRHIEFWSGDVWKVVVLLKKYRPELSIHTVATPPTGMCIVRNLDPGSRFIADNLRRLVEEFSALDYGYLAKQRGEKLNLVPNEWERIRGLLG